MEFGQKFGIIQFGQKFCSMRILLAYLAARTGSFLDCLTSICVCCVNKTTMHLMTVYKSLKMHYTGYYSTHSKWNYNIVETFWSACINIISLLMKDLLKCTEFLCKQQSIAICQSSILIGSFWSWLNHFDLFFLI